MNEPIHKPVMVNELMANAIPNFAKTIVDVTFGLGGHTKAILDNYPQIETVIAIDRDAQTLENSLSICPDKRIKRFHAKASQIPQILNLSDIDCVDAIIMDAGVSSVQLDQAQRGFSFSKNGPLDMRMDQTSDKTAEDVINSLNEVQLRKIIKQFGEEKFYKKIASKIVEKREKERIVSTEQLAQIVKTAIPERFRNKMSIHPATRTFQAIRMFVNDELAEMEFFLEKSLNYLCSQGRISVISFHSLEDRLVKTFFNQNAKSCICPPDFPVCNCNKQAKVRVITKKPVTPDETELLSNPRSRSAKLRTAEKI